MIGESVPLTAQLFSDALRRRGFVVEQASKGFEAVAAAPQKPDVYLLSRNLDGTPDRGLEKQATPTVRRVGGTREVRIYRMLFTRK
jgi:DNA-binding response OmpR family regulator